MNWLYILVMGYIILSALRGFHKGFLRVIYGAAAWIIAVLFIAVTAPMVRNVVLEKTPLEAHIETGCAKMVRNQVNQKLEDGSWMDFGLSGDLSENGARGGGILHWCGCFFGVVFGDCGDFISGRT